MHDGRQHEANELRVREQNVCCVRARVCVCVDPHDERPN